MMFRISKCRKYNSCYTFQGEMHSTNSAEKFNDSHTWIWIIIRFERIKTKIENKYNLFLFQTTNNNKLLLM